MKEERKIKNPSRGIASILGGIALIPAALPLSNTQMPQDILFLIHSLDGMLALWDGTDMRWDVEFTDEFEAWWLTLTEEEQIAVDASVRLLEARGPQLPFPHSSGIHGSKHGHMRELRTQHEGRPYRTLYAFDPRRTAILLLGGDKTGDDQWYDRLVPVADKLYDAHLQELQREGETDG